MSVIHAPEQTPLDARLLAVPAVLVVAFAGFIVKLWNLQVVQSADVIDRAGKTAVMSDTSLAPRGRIVDRADRPVADVRQELVVVAKLSVISKLLKDDPAAIDEAASLLGLTKEAILKKLERDQTRRDLWTPVSVGVSTEVASKFVENPDRFPGFDIRSTPMRSYWDTTSLAHILGYVWTPNDKVDESLRAQGVTPAEYVGRAGLEQQYELALMGKPGSEKFGIDAKRRPIRYLGSDEPVPGKKLVLSIDLELQRLANRLLDGHRGAVVALDPQTGGVLALASSPNYDAKVWQGGISHDDYQRLLDDPGKPLYDRGFQASYAPGSTFKVVTSIAALRAGVLDPSHAIVCPGYLAVGRRRMKCENHGPGAVLDYRLALTKSCNTYFGDLARKAGIEQMRKACADLGLGERTGLDVPGEGSGFVSSPEWLERMVAKGAKHGWYEGDTVNMGIGQGELAVTPLQMAEVASLVANRGVSYRPHVVKAIVDPQTKESTDVAKQVLGKVDAPGWFWSALTGAMNNVIEGGTARSAQIPGLSWAGKTGSAENDPRKATHAWFIGFAPLDNPKIAVCVLIENGGHGGDVSAPIARQVVARYLGLDKDASASTKP
ncbi:MAG: penicillin-binding protein 2 [Fimbriimonadaceae bacterium]|nr:penicillin-binding protein 2 [Fimbriimonadaceae bacterium]